MSLLHIKHHEGTQQKLNQIIHNKHATTQETEHIWYKVNEPVNSFIGRNKELERLHNAFHNESKKQSRIVCISGMGGVGKSELARKYAHDHEGDYNGNVIWINAENYQTLAESFRRLAEVKLGILTKNSSGEEKDVQSIVETVFGFFSKLKSLFIFDNAEKLRTQKNTDEGIDKFLPSLSSCAEKPYILITSRNRKWSNIEVIYLNIFTEKEACDFIINELSTENEPQTQNLAERLQYFPLALKQAMLYIKETDMAWKNIGSKFDIDEYLKIFDEKSKKLLDFNFPDDSSDLYTKTTFTTWKITIDKIVENNEYGEQAGQILDTIAYLAADRIPVRMFIQSKFIDGDEEKFGYAVGLLKQYSMVNSQEEPTDINIHRLVQLVTRINLKNQNKEDMIVDMTRTLLIESFIDARYRQDYTTQRQLLPHLEMFLSHFDNWLKKNPSQEETIKEETHLFCLLKLMSKGYYDLDNPQREKDLLERASRIQVKHYGPDHFEIARTLNNLGLVYGALGDHQKGNELLVQSLAIYEKHYGPDHFEVATTLNNLGIAYGALGDHQKQKELLERDLANQEKHYGPDHFEVATTLNNLGLAYEALGDHQKKKELLERALAINEKHYGSDHFEVATTLNNLGLAYGALGDHQKKKEFLEGALAIYEKHYGPDHFKVATTQNNLGLANGALGDHQKKKELLERAIAIYEKHYGPDHFEVATTLNNLGLAYGALGYHQKKKELLERALAIYEKHYGPDHFKGATTLNNLGMAYGALGDHQKKKELLERALAIKEKHYGTDHFEVATTLHNLGLAYGALGDHRKEKVLLERALAIQEKHYGPDHFEVATTLHNLGLAYGALGDHQKEKVLLERALAIQEKHYSPDHFKVATTLNNLGVAYVK